MNTLPYIQISRKVSLTLCFFCLLFFLSCSDDGPDTSKEAKLSPVIDKSASSEIVGRTKQDSPVVYVEELDQFQEFFKEQHETSFSHVANKNWMSFTAGKDGVLTKILLFGKANYLISQHYGSAMRGFVRKSNPNNGPKLGQWELSRDDIVAQLANQGLQETEPGWITIAIKGRVPQENGSTYFLVCDQIDDDKSWFGAFAFSEGNTYLSGRHWLHPDHDLVFRTYVGKTSEQIDKEQKKHADFEPAQASQTSDLGDPRISPPPPPKPMISTDAVISRPIEYKPAVEVDPKLGGTPPSPKSSAPDGPLLENEDSISPPILQPEEPKAAETDQPEESVEPKEEKSLFNRLFKKNEQD